MSATPESVTGSATRGATPVDCHLPAHHGQTTQPNPQTIVRHHDNPADATAVLTGERVERADDLRPGDVLLSRWAPGRFLTVLETRPFCGEVLATVQPEEADKYASVVHFRPDADPFARRPAVVVPSDDQPDSTVHFHAGYNQPGYLPENEPATFTTFADAKAWLLWELNLAADNVGTWADEHDCDDVPCPTYGDDCPHDKANSLSLAAEDLNLNNGPEYGDTVAGTAYWITPCAESDCAPESDEDESAPVRQGSHDPIAYTFEADHHCPNCAARRFGTDAEGSIPADAEDREGNSVGAVFPWNEWWNVDGTCETLACSDCGAEIDTAHADPHSPGCPDFEPDDEPEPTSASHFHVGHDDDDGTVFPTFAGARAHLLTELSSWASELDDMAASREAHAGGASSVVASYAAAVRATTDQLTDPGERDWFRTVGGRTFWAYFCDAQTCSVQPESEPQPTRRNPNPWPKTPGMSRADFAYLARILAGLDFDADGDRRGGGTVHRYVVEQFAYHLADTNARFNRDRFVAAASGL